jgi:hypothetical protein
MKHGFKIYDTDTHLAPSAETIRPYLAVNVIERSRISMSISSHPVEPSR